MSAVLTTGRLRLEPCRTRHFADLRLVNGDPSVMRFVGGQPQTPEETAAWIMRAEARWRIHGYSWWVIRLAESDAVIGASCLQHIENDPAQELEIGWRLLSAHWGMGYATEAAAAIVDYAFGTLNVPRLLANADPANSASIRVMQRLGMRSLGLKRHYGQDCATYVL
ncbi:N-acetyltransferase [Thalassobaculum fulvum]|uniref:N-acetyltransferase n=1 Tax=Thalassobaculum fulvum TaxID=1633335 RepID=A0A918XP03_9PROT|nr:GNAT family N-acetyltransferase [Thalassobaculum fulvum]GHD43423.1 N-acetyltransferase [Thalassobaculum fulvum]